MPAIPTPSVRDASARLGNTNHLARGIKPPQVMADKRRFTGRLS